MRRYLKISLLLLLTPLLIRNVYANEKETEQISIQIEESLPQENIEVSLEEDIPQENIDTSKEDIPPESIEQEIEQTSSDEELLEAIFQETGTDFNLELDEMDNFSYQDESNISIVEESIKKRLEERLHNNNYDFKTLGYEYDLYWNYFTNNEVKSYAITIYKNAEKILTIPLNVTFQNTESRTEEEEQLVKELIDNNNFTFIKEHTIDEVLDQEENLYPDLEEEINKIVENTEIEYSYPMGGGGNSTILSNIIEDNIIVFGIRGIIYGNVNATIGYLTKIDVPSEEDEKSFVEKNVKEKLTEYDYLESNKIEYDIETGQITGDNDINYGNVKVNKVTKKYNYIEGSNSTIQNKDTLKVRVNGDLNEFKRVEVNSVEVNPKYYTVSSGSTIINIQNEFIRALSEGTYQLSVIFQKGRANTSFTIKNQNQKPVERPSTPHVRPTIYYPAYHYEEEIIQEVEEKEEQQEEIKEVVELPKIEDDSKDKDIEIKITPDETPKEKEKKEKSNWFMEKSRNLMIPLSIAGVAILVAIFGVILYIRNKEDD